MVLVAASAAPVKIKDEVLARPMILPRRDLTLLELQQHLERCGPARNFVPTHISLSFPESEGSTEIRFPAEKLTLREFVEILDSVPAASLATHFQRHDFSRWLQDVFGDYPLASTVREIEDRRGLGNDDGVAALTQAVRARYDFVDPFHP